MSASYLNTLPFFFDFRGRLTRHLGVCSLPILRRRQALPVDARIRLNGLVSSGGDA